MAPNGGRRLWPMVENSRGVLAIEWLAACQGLDFRGGLKTTAPLELARQTLREKVSYYDKDRFFAPDIEQADALLKAGSLSRLVLPDLLPSH
jgi:histidine ammonia-lyase